MGKIDWERLCEHPFIKFGHRVMIMLGVPVLLWVGSQFVWMRDEIRASAITIKQIVTQQDDFETRIRELERKFYDKRR